MLFNAKTVSQRGRGLSHSLLFYNQFFYFYYQSSRTNVQSYLIDFVLFCDIPFDLHRWSKKGKQRDRAPGMNAFPIRATLLLSQGNVNVCTEDSPDRENGVRYHKSWYPGISTKGSFNSYVDKRGWVGGQPNVHGCPRGVGR